LSKKPFLTIQMSLSPLIYLLNPGTKTAYLFEQSALDHYAVAVSWETVQQRRRQREHATPAQVLLLPPS
jgi:hypothetical protein